MGVLEFGTLFNGNTWHFNHHMKDIQVVDGAKNCVYEIFQASEAEFELVFPSGTDIAFIDEVYKNGSRALLDRAFEAIWTRRVPKAQANGIHGLLSL